MKATFAFLADTEIHNFVRKLAWDIHRNYGIGLDATCLPPHISLKQPFAVADLDALESYMQQLVKNMHSFKVHLPQLQLVKTTINNMETGILWLDVQETEQLRQTHLQLNHELAARFENTQAPFDGADYHFHMTIAIGGQPWNIYQTMFGEISSVVVNVNLQCLVRELALFVYDDNAVLGNGYMTYKILPLSG